MNINLATIDFCPGGGSATLQEKSVTITTNGSTVVTPDEGYDGMSKTTVTTNVQPTLQSKTSEMLLSETSKSITADAGYDGLSSVTVTHAPVESNTNSTITTNGSHVIIPGAGYDATMQVTANINVPTEQKPEETLTQTITANGTTTYSPTEGSVFDSATITVSVPTPSGTKFITENGVHNVTNYADANVSVTVEEVVPNDEIWYTTPDGTTLGFTDLTALGASYGGPTIISNTYSSGKGIIKFAEPVTWIGFKLEGSSLIYGPQWLCAPQVGIPVNKLESVYLPNSVTEILGYDHPQFSYIGAFVNCKNLIKVVMGDSISTIGAGTFTSVHETAPTFDLFIRTTTPPALGIQADAFISNATVYSPSGTTSTYQSAWSEYGPTAASAYKVDDHLYIQNKTANPSTSTQTITPDSQYVGLNSVVVNPVTSSIDANIIAGNIKKDVAILGVTGTVEEGITPTGSRYISSSGTFDVTNYASAVVSGVTRNFVSASLSTSDLVTYSGDYIFNDSLEFYSNGRIISFPGMTDPKIIDHSKVSNIENWNPYSSVGAANRFSGLPSSIALFDEKFINMERPYALSAPIFKNHSGITYMKLAFIKELLLSTYYFCDSMTKLKTLYINGSTSDTGTLKFMGCPTLSDLRWIGSINCNVDLRGGTGTLSEASIKSILRAVGSTTYTTPNRTCKFKSGTTIDDYEFLYEDLKIRAEMNGYTFENLDINR